MLRLIVLVLFGHKPNFRTAAEKNGLIMVNHIQKSVGSILW